MSIKKIHTITQDTLCLPYCDASCSQKGIILLFLEIQCFNPDHCLLSHVKPILLTCLLIKKRSTNLFEEWGSGFRDNAQ